MACTVANGSSQYIILNPPCSLWKTKCLICLFFSPLRITYKYFIYLLFMCYVFECGQVFSVLYNWVLRTFHLLSVTRLRTIFRVTLSFILIFSNKHNKYSISWFTYFGGRLTFMHFFFVFSLYVSYCYKTVGGFL